VAILVTGGAGYIGSVTVGNSESPGRPIPTKLLPSAEIHDCW
jgi:hypothetical protein